MLFLFLFTSEHSDRYFGKGRGGRTRRVSDLDNDLNRQPSLYDITFRWKRSLTPTVDGICRYHRGRADRRFVAHI